MKALFLKEIRQGKLILFFGPALALLLLFLRPVLALFFPLVDQVGLDEALFAFALGGAFLLALIAGAGLFSAEVDRGTLPVLLGLPLSRARLWLVKMTSGLILALVSSFLLLLPAYLFFWPSQDQVMALSEILLFLLWWLSIYFITLLCSILLEHTISAFLTAVLFSLGLYGLIGVTVMIWGGLLTGRLHGLFDTGLWIFSLVPACLTATFLTVKKGELLRGRRKWLAALPVFLLIVGLTGIVIVSAVRYGLRYQRDQVKLVLPAGEPAGNGAIIGLLAKGSPVLMRGEYYGKSRWPEAPSYRSRHLVALDLSTGRELLIAQGEKAAISPEGKLVAFQTSLPALTWREENTYFGAVNRKLIIWDLSQSKEITSKPIKALVSGDNYSPDLSSLAWSPKSTWLACLSNGYLAVLQPGGEPVTNFPVLSDRAWAWEATEQGLYGFDGRARLQYLSLPVGRRTFLWDPRSEITLPPNYLWSESVMALAPGGRLLAAQMIARLTGQEAETSPQYIYFDFLIDLQTGKAQLLHQLGPIAWSPNFGRPNFAWSPDGRQLFFLTKGSEKETELQLWDSTQQKMQTLSLLGETGIRNLTILPTTGELLIWGRENILLSDAQGRVIPFMNLPSSDLAKKQFRFLGLDEAGQAIVIVWSRKASSHLSVFDLTTGKLKQRYP